MPFVMGEDFGGDGAADERQARDAAAVARARHRLGGRIQHL